MKKLLISVITLFILCPVFSEEIDVYHGTASSYDTISKRLYVSHYGIKYETDNSQYYLVTTDDFNQVWIHLNYENIVTLRYILNKYLEWESMAIEKQVAIEKDIPDSRISTTVSLMFTDDDQIWLYGKDFRSSDLFNLYFTFLSRNENRHQLVIESNKVEARGFDYELIPLHLNKENVLDLLDSISEESIETVINVYNNRQKLLDEFD